MEIQVRSVEVQQSALTDRMRSEADSHTAPPSSQFNLAKLRASIAPGTVAFYYMVTADEILLFVLPSGKPVQIKRIAVSEEILTSEVRRFRHLLSEGQFRQSLNPALLESGHKLYRWLIAPAEVELDAASQLLIVPDRELYSLPFAALVSQLEPDPKFLIEDTAVHSVQSLTVHSELSRHTPAHYELRLLALADPVDRGQIDALRNRSGQALPGARQEAEFVADLFRSEPQSLLIGDAATESALFNDRISAQYLHFATHAEIDQQQPLDSFLSLSPIRADTHIGDGRLEAWEIFDHVRIDSELVMLSACDTGSGELVGSEGQLSLARAFQAAGARDVIAARWAVPDQSTAELVARFYQGLSGGQSSPQALRNAQIAFLRRPVEQLMDDGDTFLDRLRRRIGISPKIDVRHPYFWAGMRMIGPATSEPGAGDAHP